MVELYTHWRTVEARPPKGNAIATNGKRSVIVLTAIVIFFTQIIVPSFPRSTVSSQRTHSSALPLTAESYKLTVMSWIRAHPYIAAIGGAVLLILVGIIVVTQRSDVASGDPAPRTWGGVGTNLFNPSSSGENQNFAQGPESLYTQAQGGPPFYYTPTAQEFQFTQVEDPNFDFSTFLETLASSGKSTPVGETGGSLLEDLYSFIPQGLISTSTREVYRTPLQDALYNYGNDAGRTIQLFESDAQIAPRILKDQFEDRYNPDKNNALLSVAGHLTEVGVELSLMQVPPEVRSAHQKVAESYREMGKMLARIPEAKTDQAVLDAMLAHNAVVETYVKNYVALATLLSAHGVVFSTDDPGSVFTFTNVGGF